MSSTFSYDFLAKRTEPMSPHEIHAMSVGGFAEGHSYVQKLPMLRLTKVAGINSK